MSIETPLSPLKRFQRAPEVRWTVERRGLMMYTPERGVFCCIPYPCAALWDLAERDYDFAELVKLMRYIAGLDQAAANALVQRALRSWAELKLVVEC
jgi:hypothetical protein